MSDILNLKGLTGGHDATWFEVIDVKGSEISLNPAVKNGKMLVYPLFGTEQDVKDYSKAARIQISLNGYYATVAGNATTAEDAIKEKLGKEYSVGAVSSSHIKIYLVEEFEKAVERGVSRV
jgi:CO dehydrogenase/acetyl-CoA synthase gamma subunit (corrinoid Fe-S protein)